MLRTKLLALAAVTALLASGVAGAAPADGASPNDGPSVDVLEAAPPVDLPDVGPPSGLPDAVPDFVGDVLDAVSEHVENGTEGLGERISGLTPGDA